MKGVLETLQPIKRPGLPEDIAHAALWLASDESSFVNGHALVVDGGWSAGGFGRRWSSGVRCCVLRWAFRPHRRGANRDNDVLRDESWRPKRNSCDEIKRLRTEITALH